MIKLAICDDMESICEYYKKLFSGVKDVFVCGVAHDGDTCINIVKETMPDCLLLDIQMRSNDEGISIIEDLLKIKPDLKIIMITVHKIDDYVFRAFALGAKDFIYKTADDDEVIAKVLNVYNDNITLNSEVSKVLIGQTVNVMKQQKSMLYTINQLTKLSQSEISVLRGVYYGKSYREIAAERFVEEGTVRTQVSGILKKMGAKSMRVLVKQLKDMGLFEYIDLTFDDVE